MSQMDNREFNVRGRTDEELELTLQLAFIVLSIDRIVGVRLSESHGLILYQSPSPKMVALPFPLQLKAVVALVHEYFTTVDAWCVQADGDDAPCDEDNGDAWRVYCEKWGHVDGEAQARLAIRTSRAWLGK